MNLVDKKCVPCRGGIPPLTEGEIEPLIKQLSGWRVENNSKITKEFKFKNFKEAVAFVNSITEIAEQEGHHPDLYVAWGKVVVYIWTHKIDGLTESDFILAAKLDKI